MSMIRNTLARQARLFSTVPAYRKSIVDSAKDTLKSVNEAVGNAAVKGIETGEAATQKVKETVNQNTPDSTGEAKGKASELAGQAQGKASELAGKAKGAAAEVSGQAKGKAEEVKKSV